MLFLLGWCAQVEVDQAVGFEDVEVESSFDSGLDLVSGEAAAAVPFDFDLAVGGEAEGVGADDPAGACLESWHADDLVIVEFAGTGSMTLPR